MLIWFRIALRDEDVAPIHERLIPQQQPVSNTEPIPQSNQNPPAKQIPLEEDDLSSEKGVNYTKLRDLLQAQKWQEADNETYLVMIQAVGKEEGDWFSSDELLNFPCTDLRTIDNLWVKYSNGHFGFSVQKRIYLEVGGKPDGKYDKAAFQKLGDRIGWRVKNSWIPYSQVTFDTSSPEGHLPGFSRLQYYLIINKILLSLLSHQDL